MDHPDHHPLLRPGDHPLLCLQQTGNINFKNLQIFIFFHQVHPWLPIINAEVKTEEAQEMEEIKAEPEAETRD